MLSQFFSAQVRMLCSDVLVPPKGRQLLQHELTRKMIVVTVISVFGHVSFTAISEAIIFRYSWLT